MRCFNRKSKPKGSYKKRYRTMSPFDFIVVVKNAPKYFTLVTYRYGGYMVYISNYGLKLYLKISNTFPIYKNIVYIDNMPNMTENYRWRR